MDENQFLAKFRHIAAAPDGVQRLREMILWLAVTGDLIITQTPVDARPLLDSIGQKKARQAEQKKVVPPQRELRIGDIRAPAHWAPCRLGDLVLTITGGGTPSKGNPTYWGGDIPWASVKDLKDQKFLEQTENQITAEGLKHSASNLIPPGRVIVCTRMGLGKLVINKVAVAINQDLKALELPSEVDVDFFYILYRTRDIKGKGTTVTGIKQEQLLALPAALPPFDEQKSIVTKVDELMTLCDKLEAQQQERRTLCKLTRRAALDNLAAAQSLDALADGWSRVRNGISLWLDDEDAIIELRNAVGFLGCRGLLTELTPIDSAESTDAIFSLPTGWSWVTLKQLAEYITSGSRGWRQFRAPQGDIFIRSQDIKYDSLVFEDKAFVNLPDKVEGKRTLVRPGDLLVTITGANVGKCAQVPLLPHKAYVSQHIALVRVKDVRHTPFLHWWITNAFGGRKHLARFIYGDKPGLKLMQVGSIPIPLPPQEVQDRIVEALGHYAALCARLATYIKDARNLAESLTTAAVTSITGIRIEDKQKMKAPKTELVSTLRVGFIPTNREQVPLATILIRNNGQLSAKTLWNTSGLPIDAFYRQLKTEMAKGWIVQPEVAYMKEVEAS